MNRNDEKRFNAAFKELEERAPVLRAVLAKREVANNESLPLAERQQAQSDVNYHAYKQQELIARVKKAVGTNYPEIAQLWQKRYPKLAEFVPA